MGLHIHQRTTQKGPVGQPAGRAAIPAIELGQSAPEKPQRQGPARGLANEPDGRRYANRRIAGHIEKNELRAPNALQHAPHRPRQHGKAGEAHAPGGQAAARARGVHDVRIEPAQLQLSDRFREQRPGAADGVSGGRQRTDRQNPGLFTVRGQRLFPSSCLKPPPAGARRSKFLAEKLERLPVARREILLQADRLPAVPLRP